MCDSPFGGYTDRAGGAFSPDADFQCGSDCGSGAGGYCDREKTEEGESGGIREYPRIKIRLPA